MPATVTEIAAAANGSSQAAYQLTLTAGANIGDVIAVAASGSGSDAISNTSITDSKGHTWLLVKGMACNTSAHRSGLWTTTLTSAWVGGTDWVKFTTGAGSFKTIQVLQLVGLTNATVDKQAVSSNQASTASPVSGTTAALTQADELAI